MVAAPVKVFAVQASITPHARGAAKDGMYAKGAADTKDVEAKDVKAVRDVSSRALVIASGSATDAAHDSASGAEFGRLFREQAGGVALPAVKMDAAGAMPQATSPGSLEDLPSPSGARAKPAFRAAEPGGADPSPVTLSGGAPQSFVLSRLQNKLQEVAAEPVANVGDAEIGAPASASVTGKTAVGSKDDSALPPHHELRDKSVANDYAGGATPLPPALSAAVAPMPLDVPISRQQGITGPSGKGQPVAGAIPLASIDGKPPTDEKGDQAPSAIPQEISVAPAPNSAGAETAKQLQLPASLQASLASAMPPQVAAGNASEQGAAAASVIGASASVSIEHASHGSAEPKSTSPATSAFSSAAAVALPSEASALTGAHPEQPSAAAPTLSPLSALPSLPAAEASSATGLPSIYDRIDQAIAPVVLHSGVQHISVGVHDPNLGWVEIQTQNTAGHVDAMLVTASSQTHESLAAQLPSMAQFLEQRDVRVGMLGVQQQMQNSGGVGSGAGNGGAMGSGTGYSGDRGAGGHRSGSERNLPRSVGFQPSAGAASRAAPATSSEIPGAVSEIEGPLYRPLSYINVRA